LSQFGNPEGAIGTIRYPTSNICSLKEGLG
jgi:hypothetical protein